MSIRFSCDFCSRKYRVDDGLAGRKVKCKECGTELLVPDSRMVVAAAATAQDLYGLDEGDEAAPPPMPRRAGSTTESAAPRRRSKKSAAPRNASNLHKSGNSLLIFGIGIFALPMIGLQWQLINFLPPGVQMGLGLLMVVGGIFCHLTASVGVFRGLGFSVLGGLGLIGGLAVLLVIAGLVKGRGNQGPGQAREPNPPPVAQAAPPPADLAEEPLNPPEPAPVAAAPPSEPPAPDANFAPQGPIQIHLSQGQAGPSTMGMGISIQFHYEIPASRPVPGLMDLIIKCRKGQVKIVPPLHILRDGQVNMTITSLNQNDGPFEATLEPRGSLGGGISVDTVSLGWSGQPPQNDRPDNSQPDPNSIPGRPPIGPRGPRFGPRGRPF